MEVTLAHVLHMSALPIYNVGHFCTIQKVINSLAGTIIFVQSFHELEEVYNSDCQRVNNLSV
jgi:uncharacterized UBP type Zn finger protein